MDSQQEPIRAGEFARFADALDKRMTRFENAVESRMNRIEDKVDDALRSRAEQAAIDSRAVAKKAALHVSWITPVVLGIIETLKATFK